MKPDIQEIRIAFKNLTAEKQRHLLRQILEEHAYYSFLEGIDWSFESIDSATLRANKAEGKAHRAENKIKKIKKILQDDDNK